METSLSTKNKRFSNIFSWIRTRPSAWVAMASAMLVRSAGNAGQGPSSIFEIGVALVRLHAQVLAGRHDHVVAVELDPAAEPLEGEPGHAQVVGDAVPDAQLAAGAGGERDEAADLDVVGADRVVGAAELLLAVDDQQVRADALDARAHLHQQAREVLHVRLGGGVVDHRRAGRERRGHQRVLGRHDRGLVHEEVAGVQPVGRAQPVVARSTCTSAPRARKASRCGSRRRRPITSPPGGGMSARPKRASSGPASRNEARMRSAQSRSTSLWLSSSALSATTFSSRHSTFTPRREQLEHRLHVADARDVAQHDLLRA